MANTYQQATSGQVVTLISAANATGVGTVLFTPSKEMAGYQKTYTWNAQFTGAPTSVSIKIEGSLDGVNFYALDTSTSNVGELRSFNNAPAIYLRANVATMSGGTAPTVSVYLAPFAP